MEDVEKRRYVGLDLAKKTVEVCIVQDGADAVRHSGVKTGAAGRERLAGDAGEKACGFFPRSLRFAANYTGKIKKMWWAWKPAPMPFSLRGFWRSGWAAGCSS